MSNLICIITSCDVTVLRSWLENSNWPGGCSVPFRFEELVEVSQLSFYQPSKPFVLFGHGSKPLSKYTRVHRLWDTRDEGLFWKFWITRTDFMRRKWSKRIAINRSYLSLEKPKCPEIHIHDKRILKIKLFWSLTDIGYWGLRKNSE